MNRAVLNNKSTIPSPTGDFVTINGEDYCAIYDVDRMPPFFMSIISADDHWLFISSNGGLTAGRISPDTALFPYLTVDKIQDSTTHTGTKTLVRVLNNKQLWIWEPFSQELDGYYDVSRNLFKSVLGDKLRFEEINHDLGLCFRYTWQTSSPYGFVRSCELENLESEDRTVDIVDGLQNLLPAGTPAHSQMHTSNLVDAYKWTELDESTGLAYYTLYSGITDRAEPAESLRATTAFALGLDDCRVLISSEQLRDFRFGQEPAQEKHKRGIRGSYFINSTLNLRPNMSCKWQIVADIEKDQASVTQIRNELEDKLKLAQKIDDSISANSDALAKIIGRADAYQAIEEKHVATHHLANVLFNVLRGGIFADQYNIFTHDFQQKLALFNREISERHEKALHELPATLPLKDFFAFARQTGDLQLQRLCLEYLPIMFGRRHGDPSRPWNFFEINLKDANLLSYQGNWRDIFQNWEALVLSYPSFIEGVIAKFVNASTMDGYNPYRITEKGIDWEIEDPDDPWSYIGYWGDHQIIYLLKLLELSRAHHPGRLAELLTTPIFSYAHVPYRIRPFEEMLRDPKVTIDFQFDLAADIEQRVSRIGVDGKSVLSETGQVYQVSLAEKLLVPLLAKLCNLVVDGGIWMNTQRPEWNDANNALVGQGLSMVTLCYMRRYIVFLQDLLHANVESIELTTEVAEWIKDTASALSSTCAELGPEEASVELRTRSVTQLGQAATQYRASIYGKSNFETREQPISTISHMLEDAIALIDHSIEHNQRESGLYEAYNLMRIEQQGIHVDSLYAMLEGQVAVLSSGAIPIDTVPDIIQRLFESKLYRPDQDSFMLYPDRQLPYFLEKNIIPEESLKQIPWLPEMTKQGDHRICMVDQAGNYRFNAAFTNVRDLDACLDELSAQYPQQVAQYRTQLHELYEKVFNHLAFTGRSGGMFGFEGLGSIYWHMVAKLLVAVQENFYRSIDDGAASETSDRIGALYYRVREGLGFNKTPGVYGAFPSDPYSHSPKHAGAQQPGMTGQVKEELLTRFGELGIRIKAGEIHFQPRLLRRSEFLKSEKVYRYLDVRDQWQDVTVNSGDLVFTWCQVPVIYQLTAAAENNITVVMADGSQRIHEGLTLPAHDSAHIFGRDGFVRQVQVMLRPGDLFMAV